jgi:F0F1-type ATP synthase membrane subunit b/b'
VLIPVGAALIARESVVEVAKPFTSPKAAQREVGKYQRRLATALRRYERRGNTARNRFEREVKRTRTKVERELRQRRNQATQLLRREGRSVEQELKGATRDLQHRAEKVGSTTGNVAKRFQEQVLS